MKEKESRVPGPPPGRGARLLALGLSVSLSVAFFTHGPASWARPPQSQLYQTIPTRTPTAAPTTAQPTATPTAMQPTATPTSLPPTASPTAAEPTASPTATAQPTSTPTRVPPTATATAVKPAATLAPTAPSTSPAATPRLLLSQTSSATEVVPGSEVTFVLQITNSGAGELQEVLVEDVLPHSLILQEVSLSETEADISNGQWAVRLPRLASGQSIVITVIVVVDTGARGGETMVHQPRVLVGDLEQLWPSVILSLPPALLPQTGGPGPILGACLQQ